MMNRTRAVIAAILALLLVGALTVVVRNVVHKPMTIAALFTSETRFGWQGSGSAALPALSPKAPKRK
jgi:hypothetical protein